MTDDSPGRPVTAAEPASDATIHTLRARRMLGLAAGAVLLVFGVALSLSVGAKYIALADVWHFLWFGGDSFDAMVINTLRVPRTILAVAVGAALGVAGALMQALTRNPLADPGILGINSGANLGVVVAISVFGLRSPSQFVFLAFVGAAGTAVLVYALGSRGRSGATPVRLALAGTAVAAFLTGLQSAVILFNVDHVDAIRFWALGSLAGRDLTLVLSLLPFIIVGLVLALAVGPALNAIALGDHVAVSLGANVARTRTLTAIACVLLCGAATAAAGPIAFIGLMVPHAVRMVTGNDQRWLLPYCGLAGAILMLLADSAGRVLTSPDELEVSIVAAIIGAPVFIHLVRRKKMIRA